MRTLVLLFFFATPATAGDPLYKHPTIQNMLAENNRMRIEEELVPHIISPTLTRAAQDQAWYLAKTHDFEHRTKDNGSPGVRAARYGYSGTVRENLGRSLLTIPEVFRKWKESPDHWKSITGRFDEVGFGYAVAEDGTQYWVALYGLPNKPKIVQRLSRPRRFISPSKGLTQNFLLISL